MYSIGTAAALILLGASAMYLLVLVAFYQARRMLPMPWFICCCVMSGIYCVAMLVATVPGASSQLANLSGPFGYAAAAIYILAAQRFAEQKQGFAGKFHLTWLEGALLCIAVLSLIPGVVFYWDNFREWISADTLYRFPRTTALAPVCCLVICVAIGKLIYTVARTQNTLLSLGVCLLGLSGANDMAISLELYKFNFAAAAGALAFLVAVALNESSTWGSEAEQLTELRGSLEEKVIQRTAQLEETQAKLESSERLAALGRLAAAVGHEINNPLTYVLANLDHVQSELANDGDERLENAIDGAQRIGKIVEQLSGLSMTSQEPVGTIDAGKALMKAVKTLQSRLSRTTRLVVNTCESAFVNGDEGRLTQMLVNLICNSLESLPDDKQTRIVVASIVIEQDKVNIFVQDEGVGIPDKLKSRIFEPFSSGRIGGLGLGLAIVRTIVDEMNGSIAVTDVEPSGTRIKVCFDRVPPPVEENETPASDIKRLKVKKILIIDDEVALLETFRQLLRDYDVTTTEGGEEAADLLRTRQFDLIFCDLVMPELSGLELLDIALEADPAASDRFVFISGGIPSADIRSRVVNTGVRFLSKPFRLEDLKKHISERELVPA